MATGEGVAKLVGVEPKVIDAEKLISVIRAFCAFTCEHSAKVESHYASSGGERRM